MDSEYSKEKVNIKAVDFFCGAGGVTSGFLNAGIDVICGIDIDPYAKKTFEENNFRANRERVEYIQKDINNLAFSELDEKLKKENYDKLIFVGCAPCQPFTNINTIKEKRQNEKNYLLRFAEFIKSFKPDFLFVENVPGIDAKKYGGILDKFKANLKEMGYKIKDQNVNAKYYGIPQNRNRRILIASKNFEINFPEPTHGNNKEDFLTFYEHLTQYKLIKLKAGEVDPNDCLHRAANLSKTNLLRIRKTPKDGGGRENWGASLLLKCYKKHKGAYKDVYNRMYLHKPAPTITTRFNSLSNGRFGHPEEDRAISLREGALLQTFPIDYKFYGSSVTISRHIGNAVPVKLAEIFGKHFGKIIKREEEF